MYLIFDTETTGLPRDPRAPLSDSSNWPRVVQLAWQLHDPKGRLLSQQSWIVKPEGFSIPFNAEKVHGISTAQALEQGKPLAEVLDWFWQDVQKAELLVGHNIEFDTNIVGAEFFRKEGKNPLETLKTLDTKEVSTDFCAIPGGKGGKYKWPTLTELHQKLFGEGFAEAHDAAYDVAATAKCFFELISQGVVRSDVEVNYEPPVLAEANFARKKTAISKKGGDERSELIRKGELVLPFVHLHCYSNFSLQQSTTSVKKLLAKAKDCGMEAVALTDLGNLFGAFNFVDYAKDIKAIVGCEVYVAEERTKTKFTNEAPDRRFQQVLLAKDQNGYKNLSKLVSRGFTEGYYAGIPRVDKELIKEYREGLIALSGSIYGEIPHLILDKGEEEAEKALEWWLDVFEDDFYLELQRHGLPEEDRVNEVLLGFCQKYGIKPIATNNAYYLDKKNAYAHEILLAVKDGNTMSMETGRGRRYRYALPNQEYSFKSVPEMNLLFADLPQALENTLEVAQKCQSLKLKRDVLVPKFEIPPQFASQDDYLAHLAYQGAAPRYTESGKKEDLSPQVCERIDFELEVMKKMGFAGYFLIVADFIRAARDMGISVGPGRGSAAGSVVAYCIGITNIDPIKYDLLFERFLNPERVSMPDIDTDFDDVGRGKVIDYVVEKYGKNKVAQIINYGTLAPKMAIKDVARAMELPLEQANYLAKLVPSTPGITFEKAFEESPELNKIWQSGSGQQFEVLKYARELEGCVRGTGIHAAGVIIAPDDLMEYIPVCVSKDADLWVTQFDGKVVENAGMLKMDFLGLKTLTIIDYALSIIEKTTGEKIDIDKIPLDDEKTYQLYQNGDTVGTFQFESDGMQMYLRDLKPSSIEDLIAMNALYRPGPLQFIPNFINRKHGKEPVEYPHPLLEGILKNTYGIMVYQEQIMQTAQILAGYSLGGADLLRRAMGKKDKEKMAKERVKFVEGAEKLHGIKKQDAEKVFDIMEKFAEYGFNRSHSAAYSVVAYQTAYLKANFPAQYMASVLSNSMGNIEKITFFLEETKRMGLKVLGPDVNESAIDFSVNPQNAIRFGLGAIKGSGEGAVEQIIKEREKNGKYKSIWDLAERLDSKNLNKKNLESLAYAGAFDGFGDCHRAQYFFVENGSSGIEKIIKYAAAKKTEKDSAQGSLFGGNSSASAPPKLAACEPWAAKYALEREKDVVGFYISGHPLDPFATALAKCIPLSQMENVRGREFMVGGIITAIQNGTDKNANPYARITIEDFEATKTVSFFSENYTKNAHLFETGIAVCIAGINKESRREPGKFEFWANRVSRLETIKPDKVSLKINYHELSSESVFDLAAICSKFRGTSELLVEIQDAATLYRFRSQKFRIDPSPECIAALAKVKGVKL
jgi:DNA polymerase-3 subunit alpha